MEATGFRSGMFGCRPCAVVAVVLVPDSQAVARQKGHSMNPSLDVMFSQESLVRTTDWVTAGVSDPSVPVVVAGLPAVVRASEPAGKVAGGWCVRLDLVEVSIALTLVCFPSNWVLETGVSLGWTWKEHL